MADLRVCFEDLGLENVSTVQQTGNVVFSAAASPAAMKRMIESALVQRFDYPVQVQIYRMAQLRQIVAETPFADTETDMHSYVVFCEHGAERSLAGEATDLDSVVEKIVAGEGVLYWRVPKGSTLDSAFAKHLARAKYRNLHTSRNINTLRKIVD